MRRLFTNRFLVLIPVWVLIWILPWQGWLGEWPWVRVALAILLFATPGFVLSLLLTGGRFGLVEHFIGGLVLSVLMVASLGLVGRIAHLPFAFIEPAFIVIGIVGLVTVHRELRWQPHLYKLTHVAIPTMLLLFLLAVFGSLISLTMGHATTSFGGDNFTYLAYLTNWQHDRALDFHEVVFGTGGLDSIRFWLSVFPMSLAFLAETSKLPGVLLQLFYLKVFLVPIAILAAYYLYDDLLQSQPAALAAVLLQFMFLFLLLERRQPGDAFFRRLPEDKAFAAYVMAPLFFLALRSFLRSFTARGGIYLLLIGWALAFTHPVILAYAIFIAGLYIGLLTISSKDYKKLWTILSLLAFAILPVAPLRFVNDPSVPKSWDLQSALLEDPHIAESRITYIQGTPFYGFQLQQIEIQPGLAGLRCRLASFFSWSYLWILGLGVLWSLLNIKRNTAAPFVAATSLLVLICAIPYTGWLVGYFVNAEMLWRAPWLLPIGLISAILGTELLKIVIRWNSAGRQPSYWAEVTPTVLIQATCLMLIGYFSFFEYGPRWKTLDGLGGYRSRLESLAALGGYLEVHLQRTSLFVAQPELTDYLPGLSSKSKVLYFRDIYSVPYRVDPSDVSLILSADDSVSVQQRVNILSHYYVQYILTEDASVGSYYTGIPKTFDVQHFDGFWIIGFHQSAQ